MLDDNASASDIGRASSCWRPIGLLHRTYGGDADSGNTRDPLYDDDQGLVSTAPPQDFFYQRVAEVQRRIKLPKTGLVHAALQAEHPTW